MSFHHSDLTCSPLRILIYSLSEQILALPPATIQGTGESPMPCLGFQGDHRNVRRQATVTLTGIARCHVERSSFVVFGVMRRCRHGHRFPSLEP